MAFDHTYLTPTLSQIALKSTEALIGGCWEPQKEDECFKNMRDQALEVKNIERAATMLEFAIWDPTTPCKHVLSAAEMPMSSRFGSNVRGASKAGMVMLEAVGRFLQQSQDTVLGVVFDAAGSHALVRKILHGQMLNVNLEEVARVPFFGSLEHVELPSNVLPRLPVKLCYSGGSPFFGMVGPCDLDLRYCSGLSLSFCKRKILLLSFNF